MIPISRLNLSPQRVLVIGFMATILIGAALLMMPLATTDGNGLSAVDALFTATSAVTVTGLVVVDTGTALTVFGQIIVLLLIQVGGLGFMTFSTLFAVLIGKRIYFRERLLLQEALNQNSVEGIIRMLRYIAAFTFLIEGVGALFLAARLSQIMPWGKALYMGVFHAVAAFNNAGFDLFGDFRSLTGFVSDYPVNLVIAMLIVIGGLGFAVTLDLLQHRRFSILSLHTKVVLVATGILLAGGTLLIYGLEAGNPLTLGPLNSSSRILAAFFQSVSARTAGFNTIDITVLQAPTMLIMMILMFIGASPGSTGGGVKTSTITALLLTVRSVVSGEEEINVYGRRLGKQVVMKSLAIFFIASSLIIVATFLLIVLVGTPFLPTLFEAVSAFGTVGLSSGVTAQLNPVGKLIISITMFAGRLSPLTLAMALANRSLTNQMKYPEGKLIVG